MALNLNVVVMNNLRDKWGAGPIYLDKHLATLSPDEQAFMREFDSDRDGKLDLVKEVRDAIVVHSQEVLTDRIARFKQLVGQVIADRSGWAVDVAQHDQPKQPIHWLVIQVNNPQDRRLVESEDLLRAAKRHPEKPHVDIVNLTAKFDELSESGFTELVEDFLVEYFQALEQRGAKLGLFALSGHSNGTDMLQEVPNPESDDPHAHWYVPKWNPRVSLRRLRQDDPAIAHQLDICETAALQACFHGGNAAAWAEIFTNEDVVIAGTRGFSPLSSSHMSHAIAEGALTARETLEDGSSPERAEEVGLRVPNAATLRNDRGFVVYIRNPETAAQHARTQVDALRPAFDDAKAEIHAIRVAGERAVTEFGQATLDRMYALALSYQNALNSLWIIDGRPEGERARDIELVSFLRTDLFAIRKHAYSERPTPPPWLPPEHAIA